MRCLHWLIIVVLLPLFLTAQENLAVKYISARNVYISGGRAGNVAVGDQFAVLREDNEIARIEVIYAALHSATCKILESSVAVKPGDKIKFISKAPDNNPENLSTVSQTSAASETSRSNRPKPRKSPSTGKSARISGYASLQYYHIRDLSGAGLDFSQPTFRFKLKARQLWGKDYNLDIRLRSRYNLRSKIYSDDVPESEWRNRVYRISFSYDNPAVPVNFRIGRIISNVFSGVGYIDGAQLQYNFSTLFSAGVYGGFQPEYRTSGFQTTIQKYGGFLRYQKGEYGGKRLESALAMTGEYHGADVSREYISLLNQYRHNSLWSIYQTLELDINRDWRKERSGETLSLTGFYLSGNIYPVSWLSAGLSYDNRKNYYTWEMRSLADSLFLDNFRQGLRGNVQVKIGRDLRLSATCGLRHIETDNGHSVFYSFGLAKTDLLQRRIYCSFRYAGFDNAWTSGGNPSLRLGKTWRSGLTAGMRYSAYIYKMKANGEKRLTHWIVLDSRINLPARFYFSVSYQYDWGDDVKGHRLLAEFGYRF